MLKNPYKNLLFDHINGIEFFLIFWVQILSFLPLLQEGTTAECPALGSSHNRPCLWYCNRPACFAVGQTADAKAYGEVARKINWFASVLIIINTLLPLVVWIITAATIFGNMNNNPY